MKRFTLITALAALVALAAIAGPADAQTRWSALAVDSNWLINENWDNGFYPDPGLDDGAVVGDLTLGAAATVTGVQVIGAVTSPSIQIANGGGTSADVTIGAGHSMSTVADLTVGDVEIGIDGGLGVVNVQGTLNVARQLETPTSGDSQSTLSLSGSASVSAQYAFLDRQLRIAGAGVTFNTTGVDGNGDSLILGGGGTHTWEFGASGPSQLNVAGNLDLGGVLAIETPGYTPAVGSSWVLADSVSVDANDATPTGFAWIDDSGVSGLAPGASFVVSNTAGGANGTLTSLSLEQHPVLVIDRKTGEVVVRNYSSTSATVAFDAYDIRSAVGGLDGPALAGFADQNVPNGTWYESNPTSTGLGELNVSDTTALAASQDISLGTIFAPPTPSEFGEENEDLEFNFGTPDGQIFGAQVVYEGMPNNTLVLNIDPTTGEAQLVNPTAWEVAIDSYAVSSEMGSLTTSGWSSLQDQGAEDGDWYEANTSSNQLAELLVDGGTILAPSQTGLIGLGSPYTPGAEQDLVFQFALEGESEFRSGKIVYSALVTEPDLSGDYNLDGSVDAADYTIWRDNLGQSDAALNGNGTGDPSGLVVQEDYNLWRSQYGASLSAVASAHAAPEPSAALLTLGLLSLAALRRRV